jgi:glycosyltransferase involved in cell wall biosynthesis
MKLFHASSRATFAATQSLACELADRGFANVHLWSRGVDPGIFRPEGPLHPSMLDLPGPVLLNVGRVAPEKNLEEFLDTRVAGSKVVVGEGPALEGLRARYPDVLFLGTLAGEELASAFRAADCFVFPSRTDTFGLVIIEALACGVPVAAYPVRGPIDILGPDGRGVNGEVSRPAGALDDDLEVAIGRALPLDRRAALDLAEFYSWEHATDQFEAGLQRACSQADGSTAVAFA